MIAGFERETFELTDEELTEIVPILVGGLNSQVGKAYSITASGISRKVIERTGCPVAGPRLRKMIHYIRAHGLVKGLCATNSGYYKAATRQELEEYHESLRQRIDSTKVTMESIQRDLNEFRL